jgi:hypothetical protein
LGDVRRKFYVKLLAGPMVWEGRLLRFVEVFTNRRKQFEFAMAAHTTLGVEVVIQKMDVVDERMNIMMQLFQEFLTPQQKMLAAKVEEMGRDAVLENEGMMKELVGVEPTLNAGSAPPLDLDELRKEIKRDPEEVIQMNSEFFDRKFGIQKREIEESMARVVGREGDRIISAVTAGPHDRIADPVWRDILSFRITHTSPLSLGYLRPLEVHGEGLHVPCCNVWTRQCVGMAWKRQGTPIRFGVEGPLHREGFKGLRFRHRWPRRLGTQVHQYRSYAEYSRSI